MANHLHSSIKDTHMFRLIPFMSLVLASVLGAVQGGSNLSSTSQFPVEFQVEWEPTSLSGLSHITWSPDSRFITSLTDGDRGTVEFFNIETRQVERVLILSEVFVNDATVGNYNPPAWSPSGQFLSVENDRTVHIFDAQTLDIVFTLPIQRNWRGYGWITGDQIVFSKYSAPGVVIVDPFTGAIVHEVDLMMPDYMRPEDELMAWNEATQFFAMPLQDTRVRGYEPRPIGFWDASGNLLEADTTDGADAGCFYPYPNDYYGLNSLDWTNAGDKLAALGYDAGVVICELQAGHPVTTQLIEPLWADKQSAPWYSATPTGMRWSPDGRWLLVASYSDNGICPIFVFDALHDYRLDQVIIEPDTCGFDSIYWSPNGDYLIVGHRLGQVLPS
jgi:WD40 repeat protein